MLFFIWFCQWLRAAYSHLLLPVPKIMWSFWKSMPDAPKVVSRTKNKTPKKIQEEKKNFVEFNNC